LRLALLSPPSHASANHVASSSLASRRSLFGRRHTPHDPFERLTHSCRRFQPFLLSYMKGSFCSAATSALAFADRLPVVARGRSARSMFRCSPHAEMPLCRSPQSACQNVIFLSFSSSCKLAITVQYHNRFLSCMRRGEGKKEREKEEERETPRPASSSAPAPALAPPRFSLSLFSSCHKHYFGQPAKWVKPRLRSSCSTRGRRLVAESAARMSEYGKRGTWRKGKKREDGLTRS
jgi:hypothetical protein